jgi:ankyrin repeat protein
VIETPGVKPTVPRDFRDPRGGLGNADELRSFYLGRQFVQAAKECNARKLKLLLDQEAPVNYKDPSDKMTALHYIAAYRARPALRVLLKSGKCDFLIRDGQGRLPSQLAREFARDDVMARLLLIKEIRQAEAQNRS